MEDDEKFASNDSPSGSSTTYRVVRTPSPLNATSPLTPTATTPTPPLIQTITNSLQRKKGRLQRSERLQTQESATSSTNSNNSSATSTTFSAWEALVKESFGQIAWPIKITSWELVDDKVKIVPNRNSLGQGNFSILRIEQSKNTSQVLIENSDNRVFEQ
uniref:Uncharacterized protein n=1 Tax=Glossina pallidipes TaxID=7398 RepID=A0A1B0A0Z8_GLOPL